MECHDVLKDPLWLLRVEAGSHTGGAWDLCERRGVCKRQSDSEFSVKTDPGPGDRLIIGI